MVHVGIIGTAGRKEDAALIKAQTFPKMKAAALRILTMLGDPKTMTLVSGGAAYADHIAVSLFLDDVVQGLVLHLPCPLETMGDGRMCAKDTRVFDFRTNPGGVANSYHKKFQQVSGVDSFQDFAQAIEKGAIVHVNEGGFFARNSDIANQSDYLIAFSFGERLDQPRDGGTMDTWKKCKNSKIHVPIGALMEDSLVYVEMWTGQKRKRMEWSSDPQTVKRANLRSGEDRWIDDEPTTVNTIVNSVEHFKPCLSTTLPSGLIDESKGDSNTSVFVGVIGSSGRKDDAVRMNAHTYQKMKEAVVHALKKLPFGMQQVVVISGGSAFADHLAVSLFLEKVLPRLELYLPCSYTIQNGRLVFASNTFTGKTVTEQHEAFSKACGIDSTRELALVFQQGAIFHVCRSFSESATDLARKSQYLVALTFGEGTREPKRGGTYNTWYRCTGKRIHLPISALLEDRLQRITVVETSGRVDLSW